MSQADPAFKRLGIMAGTFNPPHIGHLILAQTALTQLELDHVLFMPVGTPTHKETNQHADVRIKLTELAIANNPRFSIDLSDVERNPPHYTATLMPIMAERYPASALWLLIGSDSLASFPTWYQPHEILNYCRLAVLKRPGHPIDLEQLDVEIPGIAQRVDLLNGAAVFLSSTFIRNALRSAHSLEENLRYLLEPEVIEAISEHGLYTRSG